MSQNIAYRSEELVKYFGSHRVKWSQFYESERRIIDGLKLDAQNSILDIGCGCGGLGLALAEQFNTRDYVGVEINPAAAQAGQAMNPQARIFCGDILDLSRTALHRRQFDVVFSLSCVDWNVEFERMLATAWEFVKPDSYFVATFRLTDKQGCNDMRRSYQYINYQGLREGELAAYVVLNARELMRSLLSFDPSEVSAYGYWGNPSSSAITPYEKLCFAAFAIRKKGSRESEVSYNLILPEEIRQEMDFERR